PGEECDDGDLNGAGGSTCTLTCALETCGNGQVEPELGEECDDGNLDGGDGCSATCTEEPPEEVCGDGVIVDGEICDDGNEVDDDGCDADCTYSAPGVCGDGTKAWDELCDDGNQMDGDGCESNCTPTPPPACVPAEKYVSCDDDLLKALPLSPFRALGLGCEADDESTTIPIAEYVLNSPDPKAWTIAEGFGAFDGGFVAREGASMLMLSTGVISEPNGDGVVLEDMNSQVMNGDNGNPNDNLFLPMFMPGDDDSGVLQPFWDKSMGNANDRIVATFTTQTPKDSAGYSLDFAFFSSEWPDYVDTAYSDVFVVWQVSEGYTGTVSRIGDQSTSSTSLHPHWSDKPIGNDKSCLAFGSAGPGFACAELELMGTGFEGHAGGDWLRINANMPAEEELRIFIFLADMGDAALASVVLLDRFRFRCEPCVPQDDPVCVGSDPDINCCGVVMPTG
ncbi:MAG: DUF4215 domain-containing protein, partial [Myxococcales bacterium]|nr:DUF4215 domain-containing protein [Myxococcales bacterium]